MNTVFERIGLNANQLYWANVKLSFFKAIPKFERSSQTRAMSETAEACGTSELHLAVESGDIVAVKRSLQNGARLDVMNKDEW